MIASCFDFIFRGKKIESGRKRRRKKKGNTGEDGMEINSSGDESNGEIEESMEVDMERLCVKEGAPEEGATAADSQNLEGADGIFTVQIGPQSNNTAKPSCEADSSAAASPEIFVPHPRMSALMAIKNGVLYLYGGIYEIDDKQLSLCDMYSLDLHKLDEWKTIIPSNLQVEVSFHNYVSSSI